MKKTLLTLAAIFVAYGISPQASLADHWFDKYDHDHNGHWSYEEFCAAHRAYALQHHIKPWEDAQLRAEFERWDRDHNKELQAEEAAAWRHHHW